MRSTDVSRQLSVDDNVIVITVFRGQHLKNGYACLYLHLLIQDDQLQECHSRPHVETLPAKEDTSSDLLQYKFLDTTHVN